MIYARVRSVFGDLAGEAAEPEKRGRALETVRALVERIVVPLSAVVGTKLQTGPLSINHFGQLPAVTISFNLRPGYSLGQAAQQVDKHNR